MSIIKFRRGVWMRCCSFFTMRTGWELLAAGDQASPSVWHSSGSSLHPLLWPVLFAFCLLTSPSEPCLLHPGCPSDIPPSSSWHLSFRILAISPDLTPSSISDSLSRLDACFLLLWHQPWFYSCSLPEPKRGQITLLTKLVRNVGSLKIFSIGT